MQTKRKLLSLIMSFSAFAMDQSQFYETEESYSEEAQTDDIENIQEAETENFKEDIQEVEIENFKEAIDSSIWTADDFTYTTLTQTLNGCDYTRQFQISGPAIAGFSETGEEKLKTNKNLVIPSENDKGETLVGVAAKAFCEKGLE